jgi:hypothetical protein
MTVNCLRELPAAGSGNLPQLADLVLKKVRGFSIDVSRGYNCVLDGSALGVIFHEGANSQEARAVQPVEDRSG